MEYQFDRQVLWFMERPSSVISSSSAFYQTGAVLRDIYNSIRRSGLHLALSTRAIHPWVLMCHSKAP